MRGAPLGVVAGLLIAGGAASPARAAAACGPPTAVPWSAAPVQECPLTDPLTGGEIPVYAAPLPAPGESTTPLAAGWLTSTANEYFVCQQQDDTATYVHPVTGWSTTWWAYTLSDDDHWGWTPEVFFADGAGGQGDPALVACPGAAAPAPAPVVPLRRFGTIPGFGHGTPRPIHVGADRARRRPRRRARLALRGSASRLRDGQTLVLRGRLITRPRVARVVVALQARFPDGRWHAFGIALTRRRGRFTYRYRFDATTGRQVYRLRARVPTQRGYDLRPGVSDPVRVTVRGCTR